MCGEYANEWDAFVKVLVDQMEDVNADVGLSIKENKLREVQLGAKSDLMITNMIHHLLVADAMIDSLGIEDLKAEQLLGAVQRECRDGHVSVMGIEQNNLFMKRQAFETRDWDPKEMEHMVDYDVRTILGVSFENGLRSCRVQWSDLTEGWELEEALVNVQGIRRSFMQRRIRRRQQGQGSEGQAGCTWQRRNSRRV